MNRNLIAGFIFLGVISFLLISWMMRTELVSSFMNNKPTALKEVIEKKKEGIAGTYGIIVKNLKTGQSYSSNEERSFEAGSLYKLWVMLTAFEQIEKGELKEGEVLSEDIADLNNAFNISSKDAELTEGGITLSVKDALEQMITISHNYAALLLAQRVKISSVSTYLKAHNFNDSNVGEPPKTTAFDIALLLEKLYKGELANPENTQKMLELLKRQKLNDGLPKYLPEGTQVGHKTGDIGWFKHDVGIVFQSSGDYIIVVLSESNSPSGAQEKIAEISKAVFEFFKDS